MPLTGDEEKSGLLVLKIGYSYSGLTGSCLLYSLTSKQVKYGQEIRY
jgi:hypothetical protein